MVKDNKVILSVLDNVTQEFFVTQEKIYDDAAEATYGFFELGGKFLSDGCKRVAQFFDEKGCAEEEYTNGNMTFITQLKIKEE